MSKYKYRKTGEDEYEVSRDGVVLGIITKGWSRMGGTGWMIHGTGRSHSNRDSAAYALWRESQNRTVERLV